MNTVQQKNRQRNITPNFLRFKRKNNQMETGRQPSEEKQEPIINTDRSTSRASKCSLEAYQRRILHMSKLKNYVYKKSGNNDESEDTENTYIKRSNFLTGAVKQQKLRVTSNDKHNEPSQRQNSANQNQNFIIHKLSQAKKKNTSSGKVLIKLNRTPSNPKRTQQSLQKQQERAKLINAELLTTMMKNQVMPNYMNKLKMKKTQTLQKKKSKGLKLNLKVELKNEEELKKYQIFGELGKGAYGLVRMGVNKKTNEKIAIKIYQKKRIDEPNKIKNLEREINILAELNHHVIAKLIEAIQTATEIYIILEYGGANSLYNYLLSKEEHRLSESEAKKFLFVIAEALEYLHRLDIVHRDVKAENILINRHKELKLIDFGFSLRCSKNETIDTFCGTPTYMAPEIVSKVDHCPVYTDMWSLGILFFVMLQGNYPFRAKNQNQLFEKIKKGKFEYIHNDISKESKMLIQKLLRVDPYERLTIYEVLSKENRAWLNGEPQP